MEQALAYVCCPADVGRVKLQKYCRKITRWDMCQSALALALAHF